MFEGPDAGEQAARIVEAVGGGVDEEDSLALAELARDLRSPAIAGWDDAERMIEERRASAPVPLVELLDEAAGAVRDQAVDD